MKQILVVNSKLDQRFLPFLEKVFFTVGVGTTWENYENIGQKTGSSDFQKKVEKASAVFLVLSRDAQAAAKDEDLSFLKPVFAEGRDVFVFEHCEDLKRISIKVPRLDHYFGIYITNAWTDDVVKMAETFEDSKPSAVPYPGAALEALDAAAVGTFFDGTTGMALFDLSTSRPIGRKTVCPQCAASYILHIPADMRIVRCPVCGRFNGIKPQEKAASPPAGASA